MPFFSLKTKRPPNEIIGLALVVACFFLVASVGILQPAQPSSAEPVVIQIPQEASASEIAGLLQEKGLIRSALAFRLLARFTGQESNLKAGRYLISPGCTLREILAVLVEGRTAEELVRVTIPEGYTVRQMASLLEAKGITSEAEFLAVARNGDLKTRFFAAPVHPATEFLWEGFFFPDTYLFRPDTPAAEVAQRMLTRMDEVWAEEVKTRSELSLNFAPREIVTLASLVEREARVAWERPLIARVFYNRLQANMYLQSCATVQYLLPAPKPRLLEADTRIPSPYNTYLHPGLPPGPIASPGRDSLRAALQPGTGNYLYFVAKPDGTHAFSSTYGEHLRNQRRYSQ
jgi:UPF0755 protein